jgi:predicted phosphoribosyltransferase
LKEKVISLKRGLWVILAPFIILGGVPVAVVLAEELSLPLGVAVVSKITLPWNPETGYGAVAFDGTVRLNESLVSHLRLSQQEVDRGVNVTHEKVQRRAERFGMDWHQVIPSATTALLVDDGLASGFTLRVAAEALRNVGVEHIIIAVPTGHLDAVLTIATEAALVYCANIRAGWSFAVADAYEVWSDVSEEQAVRIYGQAPLHAGAGDQEITAATGGDAGSETT